MRILVIDALARASGKRYSTFDVVGAGPRVVAGIASNHGYSVDLKTYEEVTANPRMITKYDALLISAMSSDEGSLSRILTISKKNNYQGKILVGGPISFDYYRLLNRYDLIDYVIVGEAEIPLPLLLSAISSRDRDSSLNKVPAIAFRDDDEIVLTSKHIYTPKDVISRYIPWTRIDTAYPNHRVYRYYVEVVRGCSNFLRPLINGIGGLKCIRCMICESKDLSKRINCPMNIPPGCGFCSVPYMFGPARTRSIESVYLEVRELVKHGARRIVLSAPDFLDYGRDEKVKPKPLTDPCSPEPNTDMIDQLLGTLNDIPEIRRGYAKIFVENIKACLLDEKTASILGKYFRNTTIHIGLETADSKYNREILGKPISLEHVISAVKLLKYNGIRPYVYLIYGLPLATPDVYIRTIKAVEKLYKLGVEKFTLYKFTPLPGTAFQNMKIYVNNKMKKYIEILKSKINQYNYNSKKSLLGKKIKVILYFNNGKYYGYPLLHGPTVFVKGIGNAGFSGCVGEVLIYDIAPRFVWGKLVRILSC